MADLLAREFTTNGEPTGWVWYLLDDGKTVLSVEFADDPDYPDLTSGDSEAYPLKDFIKNQNVYGKQGLIYCKADEPDFDKIFDEGSDDEYCLVVYDKKVYQKMRKALKK